MNIGHRTVASMLAVVAVLVGRAAPVNASTLVYFDSDGASPPDPLRPRGLYTFDTDTGVSTFRAPVGGGEYFYAMSMRPSDNTVFTVNYLSRDLWTIDIDTGATTLIGPTGVEPVGLAFNPITGDLFGLKNGGHLYSVDQTTGLFTSFIGNAYPVLFGICFSPAGQLFGFGCEGDLYTIDPLTGSSTAVGGSGNAVSPCGAIDATFTASGDLFAGDWAGAIFQTDPVTGDGVVIAATGLGRWLFGLIALPPPDPCLRADIDGDGVVGVPDLLMVLDNWGACPQE